MELILRVLPAGNQLVLHKPHVIACHDGQRLGFFFPARAGWSFAPLTPGDLPASLNDRPLRTSHLLAVGDAIRVGPFALDVAAQSVEGLAPPQPAGKKPTRCRVVVAGHGECETEQEILLGSAPHCGLCVPVFAPLQALLIPVDGDWVLFDLTGNHIARASEPAARLIRLVEGDYILLSGAECIFTFEPIDPPGAVPETVVSAEATHTADGCNQALMHVADDRVRHDPVYAAAWKLCWRLVNGQLGQHPAEHAGDRGVLGRLWSPFGAGDREALERLEQQLARAPHARDVLLKLARFLEELHYLDLCRVVLKEMYRLEPRDANTLSAITRLCLQQARQTDRPVAERVGDYDRAARYLGRALAVRPDVGLEELKSTIAAERTILKGHLDRLTAPASGSARD
jgi:hypothetical protein